MTNILMCVVCLVEMAFFVFLGEMFLNKPSDGFWFGVLVIGTIYCTMRGFGLIKKGE
jgi:hypothetical protein